MDNYNIPPSLKEEYEKNNLVLFVGSGISQELGLPSWKNLMKDIIDYLVIETNDHNLKLFNTLLDQNVMDILDILNQIEKRGQKKKVLHFLRKSLKINGNHNFHIQNVLFEFCPRIITTNYDHAFDLSISEDVDKIIHTNISGLTELGRLDRYIFKIHGDIDDTDSCILFESDYKDLYEKNVFLIERLKAILLDKTLLFIGFSLTDPYIIDLFKKLDQLTKQNIKNHFIVTTDTNFTNQNITPIIIENYSDLELVLNQIKGEPLSVLQSSLTKTVIKPSLEIENSNQSQITILYSSPINKENFSGLEYFTKPFEKFNVQIKQDCLNLKNLRDISKGYLILYAEVVKGKLIIEDEYLMPKQITHEDLVENCSDLISGVFVFVNKLPDFKENYTNIPICYFLETKPSKIKGLLDGLTFKLFDKKITEFNGNDAKIFNKNNFVALNVTRGKSQLLDHKVSLISRYIDKKLLTNFVGRNTDIENLVRKIIELEYESKILTVKGAGGIGKTTVIIKSALELAKRNLFDSIEFISCQSITSSENFKYQISICLNLKSSLDLKREIPETIENKKTIIILDNFETLLHNVNKDEILEIVSFLCDYCIVITTSRELLNLDFEDIYELRNLTTQEGVELFKKYYVGVLDEEDEEILRNDIIEDLLNKNPLAIKIISKGLPKEKVISALKNELKENLFNNDEIDKIFEKPEDINIEKSKSLYYSIKYSYDQLNEKEKFAFELLSLFPDGIHIENFKQFAKSAKGNVQNITDKEIKSLDDKSLLESSGGFVKLQSIINRFSRHQFLLRDNEIKSKFYTQCFNYNYYFLNLLQDSNNFNISKSLSIQDDNRNNYLICLDFIQNVNRENETLLDYVDALAQFFRRINQSSDFLIKLDHVINSFQSEKENRFLNIIRLYMVYWCNSFDGIPQKLEKLINNDQINDLNIEDKIDKLAYVKVMSIRVMEGDLNFWLNDLIKKWNFKTLICSELFQMGFIDLANKLLKYDTHSDFLYFELQLAKGELSIDELNKYIDNLYKKETLEIIQVNYTKQKLDPTFKQDTSKFVISNPYTKGIVFLIKALSHGGSIEEKIELYKKAIDKLEHIKYYYVEAIYYFCVYLKSIEYKDDYIEFFKKGKVLAVKHCYFYLEYNFLKLEDQDLIFDENKNYERIQDFDLDTFNIFLNEHIEYQNKQLKNRKLKKQL